MKQFILVIFTVWHYEVFIFAQGAANFLTTLTPEQQQAAKVTCDATCYVFYPVYAHQEGK